MSRTFVYLLLFLLPYTAPAQETAPDACEASPCIQIGSFNIKYLGTQNRSRQDVEALAELIWKELDLEVVMHSSGKMSSWVQAAELNALAAVSGPGRGYTVDSEVESFLWAGDETALPAIGQLLEVIPPTAGVLVVVEIGEPDARMPLTDRSDVDEVWVVRSNDGSPGAALVEAVEAEAIAEGTRVWAAGEAAAMYSIRKYVFDVIGLPRADATIRGYWKLR